MKIEAPIIGTIKAIERTISTGSVIETDGYTLILSFTNSLVRNLKVGDLMEIKPQPTKSGENSKHFLLAIFTREIDKIKNTIGERAIGKDQIFSLE